jgi:hypothetical protein
MARKKMWLGMAAAVLAFGLVLTGCFLFDSAVESSIKCSQKGKCDSSQNLNKVECDNTVCAAREKKECNCLK